MLPAPHVYGEKGDTYLVSIHLDVGNEKGGIAHLTSKARCGVPHHAVHMDIQGTQFMPQFSIFPLWGLLDGRSSAAVLYLPALKYSGWHRV